MLLIWINVYTVKQLSNKYFSPQAIVKLLDCTK